MPVLHLQPAGQAAGQEPRAARPGDARAVDGGRPARRRHRRRRRHRPAGRPASRRPSTRSASSNATAAVEGETYKGLVFDATGIRDSAGLVALQEFFKPLMRSLVPCSRVVVLGSVPEQLSGAGARRPTGARGLHPLPGQGDRARQHRAAGVRRRGRRDRDRLDAGVLPLRPSRPTCPARWSGSGPPVRRRRLPCRPSDKPLTGRVAIVTGASRGIGEQIARVLHRDGATVLGIDVPQAASELLEVTRELDGDNLTLDITGKDAPQRIAQYAKEKFGGVDIVVHNAGITRDKKLANMAEDRWTSVIGGQPDRARADHARAARPGPRQRQRPDHRGLVDRGHRRQRRADQLRRRPRRA